MRPVVTAWTRPPAALSLPPGTIDLWRADLTRCEPDPQLLSIDERDRAARLRIPDKARQFVAARCLLRRVLGHYLGCAPQALCFAYGPQGKPRLVDAGLVFNLAHSGAWWFLAVGRGGSLGVDVEVLDPQLEWRGIAQRILLPDERARLVRVAPHRQCRTFYRLWTRKEAVLKAIGHGFAAADVASLGEWQVLNLPLGKGVLGALAWQQDTALLRRFVVPASTAA